MPKTGDDGKRQKSPGQPGRVMREPQVVPKVEQPDPASPQFQKEVREEIEKEKLDP